MVDEVSVVEITTSEALISKIIKDLQKTEGTDVTLLDILSESILKVDLTKNAINDALKAIEDLAIKRVEALGDEQSNHD